MSTDMTQRRPFSPEFADRVTVNRTSLQISDDLSSDDWELLGRQLTEVGDSMAWWVGDWLVQGGKRYGETYDKAVALLPLEQATLENYKYIAGAFESSRRRELSWGHHRVVAAFGPEAADTWLQLAEEGGWSMRELRAQIRESLQRDLVPSTITPERLTLTVPEERANGGSRPRTRAACRSRRGARRRSTQRPPS
jgi:hypothetical protein